MEAEGFIEHQFLNFSLKVNLRMFSKSHTVIKRDKKSQRKGVEKSLF